MKETILSNVEKSFVLTAVSEGRRLDGRKLDECRQMQIFFGTDWGCCMVCLGETKVLAQVSCEVQVPKATRPNEGLLFLNVELSPMAAPHFEAGRQSELGVQLNRLIEKCIKDSRCVDLESLCIIAEEKVWALRVDIHVLNHEGNLVDAASTAALTALCHFRRPDVTTTGEQIVIHEPSERDPIPISLHHHPVCVTYAMFNKGEVVIIDPTVIEERVAESHVVFGVNAYKELCGLHLGGKALLNPDVVVNYAGQAANRAAQVVQMIKTALEEDNTARAEGKPLGFAEFVREGRLLAMSQGSLSIQLNTDGLRKQAWNLVHQDSDNMETDEDDPDVISIGRGLAELIPKYESTKSAKGAQSNQSIKQEEEEEEEEEESEDDESDIEVLKEVTYEERLQVVDSIELSGDSEEEETVQLHGKDISEERQKKPTKERGWYSKQKW
ncbi:Exosome complex component RRP45 [Blattella germanica]|nr:Exosome complex component RRP45 [Blattella germanica]